MATLAIVGAGFCGTMVATHVLRGAPHGIDRILLVERNGRDVGGVAYGTSSTSHTLNVPAGRMSAFEDDPDDFLRFVRARDPALTGGAFVPRRLYGEYLAHTLEAARRDSPVRLIRVAGEAVAAVEHADRVTLELRDGRVLDAEQVVLAVGNYPPSDPPAIDEWLSRSIRYATRPLGGGRARDRAGRAGAPAGDGAHDVRRRARASRCRSARRDRRDLAARAPAPAAPCLADAAAAPRSAVGDGHVGADRGRPAPRPARRGAARGRSRDRLAGGRHVDPSRHPGALATPRRRGTTPLPPPSAAVLGDAPASRLSRDRLRGRSDGRRGRVAAAPRSRRRLRADGDRRPGELRDAGWRRATRGRQGDQLHRAEHRSHRGARPARRQSARSTARSGRMRSASGSTPTTRGGSSMSRGTRASASASRGRCARAGSGSTRPCPSCGSRRGGSPRDSGAERRGPTEGRTPGRRFPLRSRHGERRLQLCVCVLRLSALAGGLASRPAPASRHPGGRPLRKAPQ